MATPSTFRIRRVSRITASTTSVGTCSMTLLDSTRSTLRSGRPVRLASPGATYSIPASRRSPSVSRRAASRAKRLRTSPSAQPAADAIAGRWGSRWRSVLATVAPARWRFRSMVRHRSTPERDRQRGKTGSQPVPTSTTERPSRRKPISRRFVAWTSQSSVTFESTCDRKSRRAPSVRWSRLFADIPPGIRASTPWTRPFTRQSMIPPARPRYRPAARFAPWEKAGRRSRWRTPGARLPCTKQPTPTP